MNRYLVKKVVDPDTAWLVVTETDAGEQVTWTRTRELATPLLKGVAELWIWDLGGELDPVD